MSDPLEDWADAIHLMSDDIADVFVVIRRSPHEQPANFKLKKEVAEALEEAIRTAIGTVLQHYIGSGT